jgi:uncharacterized repeat protein (TIGR02543 family)
MKKLTMIIALFLLCGLGYAQTNIFQENFNQQNGPPFNLPPSWSTAGQWGPSMEIDWVRTTFVTYSGAGAAWHQGCAECYENNFLISPKITIPATGAYELTFYSRVSWSPQSWESPKVWISTTDNEPSSFNEIRALTAQELVVNNWVEIKISLVGYSGDVYLAFQYAAYDGGDWYIDEISIDEFFPKFSWSENFNTQNDGPGTGLPSGWVNQTVDGFGGQWQRTGNSANAFGGSGGAAWHQTPPVMIHSILASPKITLPATGDYELIFQSRVSTAPSSNRTIGVWISTTGVAGSFTKIRDLTADEQVANVWTEVKISLADYSGDIFLGFSYDVTSGGGTWIIDELSIEEASAPPAVLFSEDFEGTWPPAGWLTDKQGTSSFDWGKTTTTTHNSSTGAAWHESPSGGPGGWPDLNSWLITPPITLPDGENFELEFASRIGALGNGARNYSVMISTNGGTDRSDFTTAGTITHVATNTWETKTVSLAAYSGTIRLAFAFDAVWRAGGDWFIDDVVIKEGGEVVPGPDPIDEFPWTENFNATTFPPKDWSIVAVHPTITWARNGNMNYPSGPGGSAAHGTLHATNVKSHLITPPIVIPDDGLFELEFFSTISMTQGTRTLQVLISTDANPADLTKYQVKSNVTHPGAGIWVENTLSLAEYNGQTIYIAFLFESATNAGNLFIDDVQVREISQTPNFIGDTIFSISGTPYTNVPNTLTGTYSVLNRGLEPLEVTFVSSTSEITVEGLPITIPATETGTFQVRLQAQGLPLGQSFENGNFVVSTNDPDKPTVSVRVRTQNFVEELPISEVAINENFNQWESPNWNFPSGFWQETSGGIANSGHRRANIQSSAPASEMRTPYVKMGANPRLSFHYNATNNFADLGEVGGPADKSTYSWKVQITKDYGATWTDIRNVAVGACDATVDFKMFNFDLSAYANETCMVRIVVDVASDAPSHWTAITHFRVDDFVLGTVTTQNDLAVVQAYSPSAWSYIPLTGPTALEVGTPTTHGVFVRNLGTQTQNNETYNVKLMRQGSDVALATVPGVTLAFNETKEFTFDWTPTQDGSAQLYAVVNAETDQNRSNDTTTDLDITVILARITDIDFNYDVFDTAYGVAPFNFANLQSVAQTIYYPHEIGTNAGVITELSYRIRIPWDPFTSLNNKNFRIWIGETNQNNLESGWANPRQLQLVYDGAMSGLMWPNEEGYLNFPLDAFYDYKGGNLVVYTYGFASNATEHVTFWQTEFDESSRTRTFNSNEAINPDNPGTGVVSHLVPNVRFKVSLDGTGSLAGVVSDKDGPLANVDVKLREWTAGVTKTNAAGEFSFPYLKAGSYTIEIVEEGYASTAIPVVIEDNDLTTQNITLRVPFDVTVGTPVNGTITVMNGETPITGTTSLPESTELTLTATPAEGYEFVKWWDDETDLPRTFVVTGNVTINATFAIKTYEVTYATPTNGTLIVTAGGNTVVSGTNVDHGTVLTITATPNTNFVLAALMVNGTVITSGQTYTVTGATTIVATFSEDVKFALTLDADPVAGGTIVRGAGSYFAGEQVTIEASENTGYNFTGWFVGATTTNPVATTLVHQYTMPTAATTLTARFALKTYQVTFNANGGQGTMAPQTFTHGVPQALNAYTFTNEGKFFNGWATTPTGDVAHNNQAQYTATADATLYAVWSDNPLPKYTVTITQTNGGTIAVTRVVKAPVNSGDELEHGTELTLVATPAQDYEFVKWIHDDHIHTNHTHMLTDHVEIKAEFRLTSSIRENIENKLSVYPNPVQDVLNIQTEEVIKQIVVLDLTGRIVLQLNGNHRTVNLQAIPTGNYIVRIHTETAIIPVRIVKQ